MHAIPGEALIIQLGTILSNQQPTAQVQAQGSRPMLGCPVTCYLNEQLPTNEPLTSAQVGQCFVHEFQGTAC